jgi:hypothetical protein
MKAFTLTAALVAIALSSPLANAAGNATTAVGNGTAPANGTNPYVNKTDKPVFLPGVGTPPGLGSSDGSGGKASPAAGVHGADMGSTEGAMAKPMPAGTKNTTTPAPSKSAAHSALVGAGVAAVAASTVFSVALL